MTKVKKNDTATQKQPITGDTIPDFIALSNNTVESSLGYLQGVENSDASGPYLRRDYFSDSLTFTMLYYPKSKNKDSVKMGDLQAGRDVQYSDFICFAFVFIDQSQKPAKSYHDDPINYPAVVKSYVRKDQYWSLYSQSTANNLTELTKFEIDVILSNVP